MQTIASHCRGRPPKPPPTAPEVAPLSSPEGDTNASSTDTNAIEAPSGAVGGALL